MPERMGDGADTKETEGTVTVGGRLDLYVYVCMLYMDDEFP